jgi:hypothetical protein
MNIDIFFWSDFVKQSCQHIEDWSKIDPFSSNIKYQRISGKTWTYRVVRQWWIDRAEVSGRFPDFSINKKFPVSGQSIIDGPHGISLLSNFKILIFRKGLTFVGLILGRSAIFRQLFWTKSIQKNCLYVHEKLQRNPSTLWIWKFWIFDKQLEGSDEVKNSIGLQGPRLMAWTTKSPIRGNHWLLVLLVTLRL